MQIPATCGREPVQRDLRAYDVVGDDAKRKEYDEVRRLGPAGGFAGPGQRWAGATSTSMLGPTASATFSAACSVAVGAAAALRPRRATAG